MKCQGLGSLSKSHTNMTFGLITKPKIEGVMIHMVNLSQIICTTQASYSRWTCSKYHGHSSYYVLEFVKQYLNVGIIWKWTQLNCMAANIKTLKLLLRHINWVVHFSSGLPVFRLRFIQIFRRHFKHCMKYFPSVLSPPLPPTHTHIYLKPFIFLVLLCHTGGGSSVDIIMIDIYLKLHTSNFTILADVYIVWDNFICRTLISRQITTRLIPRL